MLYMARDHMTNGSLFQEAEHMFLKKILVVGVGGEDEFKGSYVNFKGTEWDASESVFQTDPPV